MKQVFSAILLASLAFGQTGNSGSGAASAPAIPVEQENAAKAKALLDQMIQALGGQAYLTFQDKSEEGRGYALFHGESNSTGTPFVRFTKFPDKERVEMIHLRAYHFLFFTVGNVAIKDKSDVVLIHDADQGWEITYKGTAAEPPADTAAYLRRRLHSLEWVLRKWLTEPGVALFYEGSTVAAQKEAERVTIMNSQNDAVTLYIDSSTHLPVKKNYSWRDPTDKQRNVEEEIYDHYREVQGIMTPFDISRYYNGEMSAQRFVTSVAYNKGLNDSMFTAQINYDPNKPTPKK